MQGGCCRSDEIQRIEEISMTTIVSSFIRAASQPSNLPVVLAFGLAGLVLALAAIRFGLDFGPGILG